MKQVEVRLEVVELSEFEIEGFPPDEKIIYRGEQETPVEQLEEALAELSSECIEDIQGEEEENLNE